MEESLGNTAPERLITGK